MTDDNVMPPEEQKAYMAELYWKLFRANCIVALAMSILFATEKNYPLAWILALLFAISALAIGWLLKDYNTHCRKHNLKPELYWWS